MSAPKVSLGVGFEQHDVAVQVLTKRPDERRWLPRRDRLDSTSLSGAAGQRHADYDHEDHARE